MAEPSSHAFRLPPPPPPGGHAGGAPGETLRRVDPTTEPRWDEWVDQLGGSFFHTAAWIRLVQGTYGYEPIGLVLERHGAICGLQPILGINSWLTGRRGVGLPFTDSCAPLAIDVAAQETLLRAVLDLGRSQHWQSMEWRGALPARADRPPSTTFYRHTLRLVPDAAALRSGFAATTRRSLRQAQQHALDVRFSTTASDIRHFFGLVQVTRQRQGVPPQPIRFYDALQRQLLARGQGALVLAWHQQRPVAGALYLRHGREVIYKFGASTTEGQAVRGNHAVMAAAIQHYADAGCEQFDFGRTSLEHDGLRRFKLSWGAQESLAHYHQYDFRRQRWTSAPDRSSGWHTEIFRRLPRPVSRWVGALLYPHWA